MTKFKSSVAAIITCHNRKEKTIKCLTHLMNQTGVDDIALAIYLVDDGSTDGTSDAVRQNFPKVKIIIGDGTLFWNGGMRVGFAEAMKGKYDYFLWLNDDTFMYNDAITKMIKSSKRLEKKYKKEVIITGTIIDSKTGEVNYGGRNIKSKLSPLKFLLVNKNNNLQKCDTFNGNAVLIPHIIPAEIGNISKEFSKQHSGDFDYGLRSKYAGFDTWVASGVIGDCSSNTIDGSLHDTSLSLGERIKQMKSPKGVPPAKEWMIFTKRHGGLLWPYYWLRTIIRAVFPFTYIFFRSSK